jgi:hypothetical protein
VKANNLRFKKVFSISQDRSPVKRSNYSKSRFDVDDLIEDVYEEMHEESRKQKRLD